MKEEEIKESQRKMRAFSQKYLIEKQLKKKKEKQN